MTLEQVLQTLLPRLGNSAPAFPIIDAANAVQDVIAQRLWLQKSDLLRTSISGSMLSNATSYAMPSGTLGIFEPPWITNSEITPGYRLRQIEPEERHTLTDQGHPTRYEHRSLTIFVYPKVSIDTTIKIEAYSRPALFTTISGALPWDGLFDWAFVEVISRFALAGGLVMVTPEIQMYIDQHVDSVIQHRQEKDIRWRYPA